MPALAQAQAARDHATGLPTGSTHAARPTPVQGALGNQARLRRLGGTAIQAKLAVGAIDDPLEHEADAAADHVMHTPGPVVVSRKCSTCADEEHPLQRAAGDAASLAGGLAPPAVHDVLQSPGRPLDPATHDFMASRFGADFSHVRVHTDAQAARSAEAIDALAYTAGSHVVFGAGRYDPVAGAGRRLIAHELAHTLQQGEPALRRACGPAAIGAPAGCGPGDATFVPGQVFRFVVNCDDWLGGADKALLDFIQTIPPGAPVAVDGYASAEGPDDFNSNLACARAQRAKNLLIGAGVAETRIAAASHGATPGPVADRRSVVVRALEAPATPPPTPDTPQPDAPQPGTPQPDAPKTDASKTDAPKTEPPKVDPPTTPTPGAKPVVETPKPEEHPRLVIQVPIAPVNFQFPFGKPGGFDVTPPGGKRNTGLDQAYQPNVGFGLNYSFTPTDRGFQAGLFGQIGANVPLKTGADRPLTAGGRPRSFTGYNTQLYLQPAWVFIATPGGTQVSVLVQPGVGKTWGSPVPGIDGLGVTVQGGFQITKDIIPGRLQFFGTILLGGTWTKLDDPDPGQPEWQKPQKFFGFTIGIQPVIPLINYPSP